MEILDKLNEFAKSAANQSGEIIEDTRLKGQIRNDEKSIRELEMKIGAYYYKKFAASGNIDEEVSEFCTAISVHLANIEEKRAALNSEKESASEKDPVFENEEGEDDDLFV